MRIRAFLIVTLSFLSFPAEASVPAQNAECALKSERVAYVRKIFDDIAPSLEREVRNSLEILPSPQLSHTMLSSMVEEFLAISAQHKLRGAHEDESGWRRC